MNMRECLKKVGGFLRAAPAFERTSPTRTRRRSPHHWHRLLMERLEDRICPDTALQAIANDIQAILGPVETGVSTVQSAGQSLSSIPFVGSQLSGVLSNWSTEITNVENKVNSAVSELANGIPTNQQITDVFMKYLGPGGLNMLQPIYYNQVAQISQNNPAAGTGTVTLTPGSTDVTFSTPQTFAANDFIRLDTDTADGSGNTPGPWVQIQTAGTNQTDFTLTAAYADPNNSATAAITAAWSRASLGTPTPGSDTVSVGEGANANAITFATTQTFATGDNIQFDNDGTWYQIASGGTGTSFTLTTNFSGTPDQTASWLKIGAAPVYLSITHPAALNNGSSQGLDIEMRLEDTISTTANFSFSAGVPSLPISVSANGGITLAAGFAFELGIKYDAHDSSPVTAVSLDNNAQLGDAFSYDSSANAVVPDTNATPTNVTPLSDGSQNITLTNGSTSVTFGTPQTLYPGDSVRLDSDGTWYQIASGSGQSFTLTAPYQGATGSGAWQKIAVNTPNLPVTSAQLAAFVSATLPQGFSATANVGFLEGTIADAGAPGMTGYVAGDPSTHTALALELVVNNLTNMPTSYLVGNADANLQLTLGFGTGSKGGPNVAFPSIGADFQLAWNINTNGANTTPSISFTNVTLDLGSVVSDFLGPIVQDLQSAFGWMQPVVNVLNTPIPGLSTVSNALGLGNITLMTIAGVVAGQTGNGALFQLVSTLSTVMTDIDNLKNQVGKGLEMNLGNFDLNSDTLTGPLSTPAVQPTDSDFLTVPSLSDLSPDDASSFDLGNALQALGFGPNSPVASAVQSLAKKALDALNNGYDLEFPILTNPATTIFNLLLGKDSDLVSLTAQVTATSNSSNIPSLSYFGEGLSINTNVNVTANIKMGYDTYGIRKLVSDFTSGNTSAGTIATDIRDGFYIDDSVTSLQISGQLGVSAGVSFGIASASVNGGLSTGDNGTVPIIVAMNDPQDPANLSAGAAGDNDGARFRVDSLLTDGNDPFQFSGELDAGLGINLAIGVNLPVVGFIGYQKSLNIASVTLLNFNPPASPVLASAAGADGVAGQVELYVGALAGVTQQITGVSSIIGNGGNGDLTVTIHKGVTASVTLKGGTGHAYFTDDGSGAATLTAGNLDSMLIGGLGSNSLTGGNGNDTLIAGPSPNNMLTAGPNPHSTYSLIAATGSTTMVGGPGVNLYTWIEGDGPLTLTGSNPQNIPVNNQLMVQQGPNQGETWSLTPLAGGVLMQGTSAGGAPIGTITATGLSNLSIDTPVQENYAATTLAEPVASATVTKGGSGYGDSGTFPLIFQGGGGSGAAGFATVNNGAVSSITITSAGNDYTSLPAISFTNGAGSGAQATAVLQTLSETAIQFDVANGSVIPQTPGGYPIQIGPTTAAVSSR